MRPRSRKVGELESPISAPVAMALRLSQMLTTAERQQIFDAIRFNNSPPPTPAQTRIARLLPLAKLLADLPLPQGLPAPVLRTADYDAARPAGAPSAERLAHEFGSWWDACRASYGLREDGRSTTGQQPWGQPLRDRRMKLPTAYEKADVTKALRMCRDEIGIEPSTTQYERWSNARRRKAMASGHQMNLPTLPAIYRLYPHDAGGFPQARLHAFSE